MVSEGEWRPVLPLLDGPVRRFHGHDARVERHQLTGYLEGDGGARLGNDSKPTRKLYFERISKNELRRVSHLLSFATSWKVLRVSAATKPSSPTREGQPARVTLK